MKKLLIFVIILVVVGGGAFYGGMKYSQSKVPEGPTQGDFQNLRNLSPEERQARMQEIGTAGVGGQRRTQAGEGFVTGEIISKDDKSVTVKLFDGGSKIIFFSESTEISKTAEGLMDDIEIGKQITVSGEQNSDGSYTAKMIQIRP